MKVTKSLYSLLWLLLFPIVAHAGEVPGTYAKYQWDASVAGLTSVDYDITVVVYPGSRANIRWANWFRLVGSSNGGYVGMENRANGGPSFVFSVRGATQYQAGAGVTCVTTGGQNAGVTCTMPYNWEQGTNYQFHLAYEGGQWLGVTVTNLFTNQSVTLGSILTDATSISPGGMVSRTKYLEANSPNASCYNQPYTDATFSAPSGNGGQYTGTISETGTATTCASFSGVYRDEQWNGQGNSLRGPIADGNICATAGNGYSVGAAVTTKSCNNTASQAWVLGSDGTMRLQSNLCLDVVNPDSPAGQVIVDQCNGSATQTWSFGGGRDLLINNLTGYCLTQGAFGAQLTVQECTGYNQSWSLPTLPVLP